MKNNPYYLAIKEFYGDRRAERSGVLYINHIDEGLAILDKINASQMSKEAYCIHPIFQSDEDLLSFFRTDSRHYDVTHHYELNLDSDIILIAMEYRRTANSYLSKDKLTDLRMSPLFQVREMLIADKVQNRKDFELYHKDTHARRYELELYFENWMDILGIDEEKYLELSGVCK